MALMTDSTESSVSAHLRAIVDEQVRALRAQEAVARVGEDSEGVHQMRVALRRLRAALRPLHVPDELRTELRWLGGVLGAVRDLDVQLEYFRAQATGFDDTELAAVGHLLGGLVTERERANARLLKALDGRRYRKLLKVLDAYPAGAAAREESDEPADLVSLIARPLRKLRAAASTLDEQSPDEELHALRIKGKRLRYAAELAESTGGKPVRKLIKATKCLQDVLGEHQDAVVAEQQIRRMLGKGRPAAEVFVAGRLVERERARQNAARARWQTAYRDVAASAAAVG